MSKKNILRMDTTKSMDPPLHVRKIAEAVDHTSSSRRTPEVIIKDVNNGVGKIGYNPGIVAEFKSITENILIYELEEYPNRISKQIWNDKLRIGLEYWIEISQLDYAFSVTYDGKYLTAEGININRLLREVKSNIFGKSGKGERTPFGIPGDFNNIEDWLKHVYENYDKTEYSTPHISEQKTKEITHNGFSCAGLDSSEITTTKCSTNNQK